MLGRVRVAVLGPVEVLRDGTAVELGTRKQRALVAALALHRGRPVAVDTIVDLLWGDRPPPGVTGTLQAYVAGLRRALEPDRPARTPASVLVTVEPGYALRVEEDDSLVLDRVVTGAQRTLAALRPGWRARSSGSATPDAGTLTRTAEELGATLRLWRGTPYAELEDSAAARAERARLEELRLIALEELAVTRLALGQHAAVAADLGALTAEHPLRERLWALRAVAFTRAGRQAEALEVLRRVREVLDEELGLEPGQELRDLYSAVLRQDPGLAWTPPPEAVTGTSDETRPRAAPDARAVGEEQPPRARPEPFRPPEVGWPMVGRGRELDALTGLLDAAAGGRTAFAALTGEPGIGKSRLCREVAVAALDRGATVLLGRSSQDGSAPPLWPWTTVLRGLGEELPVGVGEEDEGSRFRSWEAIVRMLLDAARDRLLLVVLEDLHWADETSLRVLRLLAESDRPARLLVVATWRATPAPAGALADAAEALARRHALRLELGGLTDEDGRAIAAAVAGSSPSATEAAALRERTDGNPFFLVEYARLARDHRRDLGALLTEQEPPAAVTDVLARRLQRLPEPTLAVLRAAAVAGRRFTTADAAAAAGTDEDGLLDRLDPALAAGLVREQEVDRFAFAHALVLDTIRSSVPASRAARTHARLAARLDGVPGREIEAAHHWAAAGPSYRDRAWPAAVTAARSASRLHAHEQAAGLLQQALSAMDGDPAASPRDRYDVLLDLVEAHRWAGDWTSLLARAEEAIEVAESLGDVELMARAATTTIQGGLWQSAQPGSVNTAVVDALRRAHDRLPEGDSALRCRVLVSLANELYSLAPIEERTALVDEAVAMAERIGDEELQLYVHAYSFVPIWTPETGWRRVQLAEETVRRARALGNEAALVVGLSCLAGVQCELGLVDGMRANLAEARELAERLRLPYALIVLDTVELPWLAMAGRFAEAEERLRELSDLHDRTGVAATLDAVRGAQGVLAMWGGGPEAIAVVARSLEDSPLPTAAVNAGLLLRAGREDEARALLPAIPAELAQPPWWFSVIVWCLAAEAGLGLGEPELCRTAYRLLEPHAGQVCSAGSGNATGPVDAWLAMAALGIGDRDGARRHADAATRLLEEWQVPLAAQWWRDQRERLSV